MLSGRLFISKTEKQGSESARNTVNLRLFEEPFDKWDRKLHSSTTWKRFVIELPQEAIKNSENMQLISILF